MRGGEDEDTRLFPVGSKDNGFKNVGEAAEGGFEGRGVEFPATGEDDGGIGAGEVFVGVGEGAVGGEEVGGGVRAVGAVGFGLKVGLEKSEDGDVRG